MYHGVREERLLRRGGGGGGCLRVDHGMGSGLLGNGGGVAQHLG